jgi:hypothetical protein
MVFVGFDAVFVLMSLLIFEHEFYIVNTDSHSFTLHKPILPRK